MQLALFTPGAYLWPVYRNFEAFLAALGTPSADAQDLASSPLYPLRMRTDSTTHGHSAALDARLNELHRDLYAALLRPRGYFAHEQRPFAEVFWPDLRHTAFEQLFEALGFYFLRRRLSELSTPGGLNLLRAVFFNHEASEPELWLSATRERLVPDQLELPQHTGSFDAPPGARVEELAFCIHTGLNRPALSAGWITGAIRRQFDGRLRVEFSCGREPGLQDEQRYAAHSGQLTAEVTAHLRQIFGWREARAA